MESDTNKLSNNVNAINEEAERLKETATGVNVALSEMRLQFETMMEMQKEERIERERMYNEERDGMRKHYGRVTIGLSLTLGVLLAGVVGSVVYFYWC